MPEQIRRVAVLGAGTMGAAIAAHAANAGLEVDLLDMAGGEDDPDAVVQGGFERMRAARPAALMSAEAAKRIRLGNFDHDFDRVGAADWVVEAIVERLEPKRELLERIEKTAAAHAVVSTNTSGIPLARIVEGRSEDLRRRFLGTHFFNPPRYLKLVEIIATAGTDPAVVERMSRFATRVLGKGVVKAKDTPNFIANRIGVFVGMHTIRTALDSGYTIEEVDALTGPLIGWPSTATFRLFDQVGLDVMLSVAETLTRLAPDDEMLATMTPPEPLLRMREAGLLGIKSGGGFYRRGKRDGRTVFDVLDLDSLEYRPSRDADLPVVGAARDIDDLGARLRFLMAKAEGDRGARFLRDLLLPAMAYAARRVPEIADSLVSVDQAMEWGFGHANGPFATWDLLGVRATVEQMDQAGIEVVGWVREMLAAGNERFYTRRDSGTFVFDPRSGGYQPVPEDPDVLDLARVRSTRGAVAGNSSASLVNLGDGVLCFELHSPASAIDRGVVEIGNAALAELARGAWAGLVIANTARNFCVGANLAEIGMLAYQAAADPAGGATGQLEEAARGLQDLCTGLRFAPVPVVAAPHGQTLGGGLELCLAADRIVAAAETYAGLVEVGVGLIPAGGGCKELVRRVVSPPMAAAPAAEALPFLERVFTTIGTAMVATSALEARELGFLADHDTIVMHPDHQLATAKREVLALAGGYQPPEASGRVYAAGARTLAALELAVQTMEWAGQASEHDGVIGRALARVLTGGELSTPQWVGEQHLLDLERAAFLELVTRPRTLERIQAMLTTGKPLRN
jgi:3-hydroxyacyl-CoA dehydrogenase